LAVPLLLRRDEDDANCHGCCRDSSAHSLKEHQRRCQRLLLSSGFVSPERIPTNTRRRVVPAHSHGHWRICRLRRARRARRGYRRGHHRVVTAARARYRLRRRRRIWVCCMTRRCRPSQCLHPRATGARPPQTAARALGRRGRSTAAVKKQRGCARCDYPSRLLRVEAWPTTPKSRPLSNSVLRGAKNTASCGGGIRSTALR
jgi:hypothetical protein